jgi:hypothetical protein
LHTSASASAPSSAATSSGSLISDTSCTTGAGTNTTAFFSDAKSRRENISRANEMSLSLSHSGLRVSVQVGVRAVGVSSKSVCVRAMAASGQWVDGGQPRHVQAARIGQLVYEGESTDQHMVQPLLVHLRVVRNRCMCACCAKRCVCQQAVGGVSPACRRHDASLSTSSDADVKQAQRNSGSERKKGLTGMAACTPFQQRDVVICEQRVTVAEPHAGHGARQRLVGWSESALIETNFSKSFHDVNDSQTRPTEFRVTLLQRHGCPAVLRSWCPFAVGTSLHPIL